MNPSGLLIATLSVVFLVKWVRNRWRKIGLLVAFLGHLFVGLLVLPRLSYTWDISEFHGVAVNILAGGPSQAASTVSSFAAFQAIVYAALGADPASLTIVNSVLAILVPFPAIYLAKRLYPSALRSTDGLFALVLFAPIPFFFMTIPMRDALSVLVFFSFLALVVAFLADDRFSAGLLAFPLGGALSLLRPELALITVPSAGAAFALRTLDRIAVEEVELPTLLGLLSVPSILAALVAARWIPLGGLNRRVEFRSSGGAAYLDGMTYETGYEVLLVAPARAIYFQFAPFPLHVNAAFDLVAASMLPLLILLMVGAYRSLVRTDTDRPVAVFLVLVYVSGVVGYGLVDSNFGTTARHRIPFTFLVAVFAAPTIQRWELALRQRLGESPEEKRERDE